MVARNGRIIIKAQRVKIFIFAEGPKISPKINKCASYSCTLAGDIPFPQMET